MSKELELKLDLGEHDESFVFTKLKDTLAEFACNQTDFSSKTLVNHYFDTPGLALNKQRMALRIREVGECFIQTLKTKGRSVNGLSERGEWEWPVPSVELDVDLLRELESWPKDIDIEELVVVFETNFVRKQCDIVLNNTRVELAFDQGWVVCGEKKLCINELELELKEGSSESLMLLGEAIKAELSISPSDISKAERGYHLFLTD